MIYMKLELSQTNIKEIVAGLNLRSYHLAQSGNKVTAKLTIELKNRLLGLLD